MQVGKEILEMFSCNEILTVERIPGMTINIPL